ncbi:hypothetical protein ACH5RR_039082 [Cinchona calisaya]|uniref:Uncharacterized protein n=1 Tax=Cinchona calisaya TaxID=153742 RepID=A0ABD2Y0M7_9GENT
MQCSMAAPKPKPREKFDIQLFDETGMLDALIGDKYAELILGIQAQEIAEMEAQNEKMDIDLINQRLKDEELYFQIKISPFTTRRRSMIRYNVLACLLALPQSKCSLMIDNSDIAEHTIGVRSEINEGQPPDTTSLPEQEKVATTATPAVTSSNKATRKRMLHSEPSTNQKHIKIF